MTNARPQESGTGAVMMPGRQNHSTGLDRHAAGYARAGIAVLPLHTPAAEGCSCGADCRSAGKHPRTRHGLDDATTDLRRIAALWACWPEANIGLRPPEGTVVLDVDPRAGGDRALAELVDQHGPLPTTLIANTGGGGLHIWLCCPGPYRGQLARGIDVKSSSGYLVAPPSVHASGRRYEWANRAGITPASSRLRRLIRRPEPQPGRSALSRGTADDGLVRVVATAAEGGRNRALHWAACRAAERGAPAGLLDQLREAARSTGLEDREIEKTVRSALRGSRTA